jgi:hypothetical protein
MKNSMYFSCSASLSTAPLADAQIQQAFLPTSGFQSEAQNWRYRSPHVPVAAPGRRCPNRLLPGVRQRHDLDQRRGFGSSDPGNLRFHAEEMRVLVSLFVESTEGLAVLVAESRGSTGSSRSS